jgi:hypothetical protein
MARMKKKEIANGANERMARMKKEYYVSEAQ